MNIDTDAERMQRFLTHLNKQILMLDKEDDILMLGCAMAISAKNIFDAQLGKDGRKVLFTELSVRE
jgi:hypothetical protein